MLEFTFALKAWPLIVLYLWTWNSTIDDYDGKNYYRSNKQANKQNTAKKHQHKKEKLIAISIWQYPLITVIMYFVQSIQVWRIILN